MEERKQEKEMIPEENFLIIPRLFVFAFVKLLLYCERCLVEKVL